MDPSWLSYRPDVRRLFAGQGDRDAPAVCPPAERCRASGLCLRGTHFPRQRARFAIARFDEAGRPDATGRLSFALFDKGTLSVAVTQFPTASRAINELMPLLVAALEASEALFAQLAAVLFLSTQSGDMLVTLIYGTPGIDTPTARRGRRGAQGVAAAAGAARAPKAMRRARP